MKNDFDSTEKPNKTLWGCLWILSIIISIFFIAPSVHEYLNPDQPTQTYQHQTTQTYQQVIPTTQTVYITRTGSRYHRADCHHLRQSKISINLNDARSSGYTPCQNCKP